MFYLKAVLVSFILTVLLSSPLSATNDSSKGIIAIPSQTEITNLINKIKKRIKRLRFPWDMSVFTDKGWSARGRSVNGLPLIYWSCGNNSATNRSLILSAVHGDEVTPAFFGFRMVEWLKARPEICENKFIVIAPIVNPDGFLRYRRGTRTNYNKVDLNRNFDTPEWHKEAHKRWRKKLLNGKTQRRYFPGERPNSEPEIHFQKWLMDEFRPTKIMSVHSPLKNLDFDGPSTEKMKIFARNYRQAIESMKVKLKKSSRSFLNFYGYGTFPGSLGNYAGKFKGIPTITAELPSTNANLAAKYFGSMEKSTRVFLEFDLSKSKDKKKDNKPQSSSSPIDSTGQPSIASWHCSISSSVSGCLLT